MNSLNSQRHYSPFSYATRKWMISAGSLVLIAALFYAMGNGVVSYLSY